MSLPIVSKKSLFLILLGGAIRKYLRNRYKRFSLKYYIDFIVHDNFFIFIIFLRSFFKFFNLLNLLNNKLKVKILISSASKYYKVILLLSTCPCLHIGRSRILQFQISFITVSLTWVSVKQLQRKSRPQLENQKQEPDRALVLWTGLLGVVG